MTAKDPQVTVEYTTDDMEHFTDVIDTSMDDKLLVVSTDRYKKVIPFNNVKNITIHDYNVLSV